MTHSRPRTLWRWVFGPGKPLRLRARLVLFVAGLVALGSIYAATDSEGLQILVLFGLVCGVYPLTARVFSESEDDERAAVGPTREPPFRLWALWLLGLAAWGSLTFVVLPDGLGRWFWFWTVIVPWLELCEFLARRDLRQHGPHEWREGHPRRDSALAGAATVPLSYPLILLYDIGVAEAAFTAVGCGAIVFVGSLVFAYGAQRAAQSGANEPSPGADA